MMTQGDIVSVFSKTVGSLYIELLGYYFLPIKTAGGKPAVQLLFAPNLSDHITLTSLFWCIRCSETGNQLLGRCVETFFFCISLNACQYLFAQYFS